MTLRILLADDEPLVRTGLRAILTVEDDLEVVGEATTGAEVLPLVRTLRPDLVLMDVRMPDVDGIQATRYLLDALPDAPKVVVITTFENDDHIYDALRAGASGFLLKRTPPAEIVGAVRLVAAGDSLLFPAAVRTLVAERAGPTSVGRTGRGGRRPGLAGQLTGREADVLRLVAAGLTNAEIAAQLYVTVETVKTHVSNILAKLGARDRIQAVIAAFESGFVGDDT